VNEKICDVNIFGVEECSQLSDSARQFKKREEYDKKIAQALQEEVNQIYARTFFPFTSGGEGLPKFGESWSEGCRSPGFK